MIKCKTYLLTRPEMEAAKKFLDKNQAMGYIELTNSPYLSPFFFIKKKDSSLRPVQNYCEINKWTIRDVYPIPQITHILEQLQGKMLFTAGGVCWALVLSCTLSDRVEAKLNLLMSSATAHATCSRLVM
jgi:hypothetical protein